MFNLFKFLYQLFCKHNYKQEKYSKIFARITMSCMKCGKKKTNFKF